MTKDDIKKIVIETCQNSGKIVDPKHIDSLVNRIFDAGVDKMALIGEAALNAEKNNVSNYSPSQHLKILGS